MLYGAQEIDNIIPVLLMRKLRCRDVKICPRSLVNDKTETQTPSPNGFALFFLPRLSSPPTPTPHHMPCILLVQPVRWEPPWLCVLWVSPPWGQLSPSSKLLIWQWVTPLRHILLILLVQFFLKKIIQLFLEVYLFFQIVHKHLEGRDNVLILAWTLPSIQQIFAVKPN